MFEIVHFAKEKESERQENDTPTHVDPVSLLAIAFRVCA
jgi:hypothetical protein